MFIGKRLRVFDGHKLIVQHDVVHYVIWAVVDFLHVQIYAPSRQSMTVEFVDLLCSI
jgi:hypothetical protein